MRIDRCVGCGEYIDISSDHKSGCPTRKKAQAIPAEATRAAQDTYMAVLADLRLKEGSGLKAASQHRRAIAAALEAAAPHMLQHAKADAWEECAEGYCEQLSKKTLDWEELRNPYRPADAV